MFVWTYNLGSKRHTSRMVQHIIELNTSIPLTHQTKYRLNPNYVAIVKHDIDKLLATKFIQPVEEATWLSPIVLVRRMEN